MGLPWKRKKSERQTAREYTQERQQRSKSIIGQVPLFSPEELFQLSYTEVEQRIVNTVIRGAGFDPAFQLQPHLWDEDTHALRGFIPDDEMLQQWDGDPAKAAELMYLRLERSYNHERQTFVFKLEISREWFIKKKDPGASLLRWFQKVAHKEVAWRARTPGFEEILRRVR